MKSRKRFSLVLLYAFLLSPWIVSGAMRALQTNANSPLDWVDSSFEPRFVLASFDEDSGPSPEQRLDVLQRIESNVSENSQVTAVTSCLSFVPQSTMPLERAFDGQVLEQTKPFIKAVNYCAQAGLRSGLLSMIPNVFPALTLFGMLGWIGHPIDIGSIMTASLAMGIAVDDTLHFLTFFQRTLASGANRRESVLAAYRHCGRAMIQTTLVCGSGLAIFCLSDFVPTARFSWMMVALLAAALVGDLIILPALLLGPIGKVYDRVSNSVSPTGELDLKEDICK